MPDQSVERREVESPRHVWVTTQIDGEPPAPGVLVEWRRVPGGPWEGLVAVARCRRGRLTQFAWEVRTEWVEASRIKQASYRFAE